MSEAGLADVQGAVDERGIALARAGVKKLRLPLPFEDADGKIAHTVAVTEAWTEVPAGQRGAHMSRLAEALGLWRQGMSLATLPDWLERLAARMESGRVGAAARFELFLDRTAPVTGVGSWLDYAVEIDAEFSAGAAKVRARVDVPVTSLCPCSKEVSESGAHSQRSVLSVQIEAGPGAPALSRLAACVEAHASERLYAVLKRADEKAVTENAYARPRFVEDVVREVAAELAGGLGGANWTVQACNFESIHNHDAFAVASSSSQTRT